MYRTPTKLLPSSRHLPAFISARDFDTRASCLHELVGGVVGVRGRARRALLGEAVRDLSWGGSRFEAFPVEAPWGLEPLSGASTVSMGDLSEALDTLNELVRELRGRGDNA